MATRRRRRRPSAPVPGMAQDIGNDFPQNQADPRLTDAEEAEVDAVDDLPAQPLDPSEILDPSRLTSKETHPRLQEEQPPAAEAPPASSPGASDDPLEQVIDEIISMPEVHPETSEHLLSEEPAAAPETPSNFEDDEERPSADPPLFAEQDMDLPPPLAPMPDEVGFSDVTPETEADPTDPLSDVDDLTETGTENPEEPSPNIRGVDEVDESAVLQDVAEGVDDDLYVAARRGRLLGSNVLPIALPDAKEKSDEIVEALSAFEELEYGQTAFIRFSVRRQGDFRGIAKEWLRARKAGEDPDAAPSGVMPRVGGYLKYFLGIMKWTVAQQMNGGTSAPAPRAPWSRGKNLVPLPASQVDEDEKESWRLAATKARSTAHYEVVMRIGAFGKKEAGEELEMLVENLTEAFTVFGTPHQEIGWESDHEQDSVVGMMGTRKPKEVPMVLSAAELGYLAHIPDDLVSPSSVHISRSAFKHLHIPSPLTITDPLNPDPGMIPIGEVNAGTDDHKVLAIANKHLDQHLIVVGKTGSGKSEWMKWIIHGIAKDNYPLVVIDPHGQLSDEILRALIVNAPERIDDIVYCDISDPDYPVALNPLDIQSQTQVDETVGSVIEMLGSPKVQFDKSGAPRAMVYAREALTALCHANLELEDPECKCTLLDVMTFFQDSQFRHLVIEHCRNEAIRQKYDPDGEQSFSAMSSKQQTELTMPIIRAFSELANSDAFSNVFTSPENKLNFSKLISSRKIVIVKLAQFAAGGSAELGSFVGALVLPWLLSTMGSWGRVKDPITGQESGQGCRVLVDEAPTLMGPNSSVPETLAQSRKWDLGLLLAAQFLGQFDDSVIASTLGNTNSKISLVQDPNMSGPIAKAIAGSSNKVTAADVASLPNYHFYGNVLLPGGPSGPFSAKALMPINDHLDDEQIKIREHVIERSRHLVANSRDYIRSLQRQRIENIMQALQTKLRENAESEFKPEPLYKDYEDDSEFTGWE